MKKTFKQLLFYVVLIALVVFICLALFSDEVETMKYSDVVAAFTNGDVVEFELDKSNVLTMKFKEGSDAYDAWGESTQYRLASLSIFHADLGDIVVEQIAAGTLEGEYVAPTQYAAWLNYLPILLLVGTLIITYVIMTKQISGGGAAKMNKFGKSHARLATQTDITFKDVAGADEEKEELKEVVEFLKDPSKFARLGAKIPHGVLLIGPPGTGKTLLAKAVAGEANVPFYSISGSDFVEMYVGLGASRVRDLFDTARKSPSAIVFIDEIDAVGRHRGAGLGGGHDEREQTLNQLLVEMDGFDSHAGIIVIAATNRPDILDPALLRPGRFDRQITVNYPDINGRVDILKVHARNKPLEASVDLREVAKMTVGFTGADLANLLNEAALLATRRNKHLIGMDDISDAYIKVLMGPQKKSHLATMKENEKKTTAYHEAGHAILHYRLNLDPVQQITIVPRGNAGGYTLSRPQNDRTYVYKSVLKNEIASLMGGRIAEEIINGDISSGASGDIDRATKMAKNMITRWGMSENLGPRVFGSDQGEVFLGRDFSSSQDYSEEIAAKIDSEIHAIITEAYEKAKQILTADIDKMHFIAEFLLKNETMDGDQFKAVMETEAPLMEEIEAIAEEKKKKSEEDNKNKAAKDAEVQPQKDPEDGAEQPEEEKSDEADEKDKKDNDENPFRRNTDTGF
ncbi:MAG: ATP-dependent zinc metalloprotease FtsH [Clostridia bacterium]|nr:ATP-dependent zinc metalloprotease FtsH [Clostridia bacterium]